MRYTNKMVYEELWLSRDAFIEVKNMLNIKEIYEDDFQRIKNVVEEIEYRYGRCTLSTVNRYKLWCKPSNVF